MDNPPAEAVRTRPARTCAFILIRKADENAHLTVIVCVRCIAEHGCNASTWTELRTENPGGA